MFFFTYDIINMVINMDINIILILVIVALPTLAQFMVKSNYRKYAKVANSRGFTGKDIAKKILSKNGLDNVNISCVSGELSDHYDPKNKTVALSNSIHNEESISSIAVAAHECGHAIQDKIGYSFMRFRSSMVPVVNITSTISSIFILIGFFTELIDFLNIGVLLLSAGLLFQLVTLPVEFDASRRAKNELIELGVINDKERTGVKKVLNAAAFTYVAGFLASALQILRLVLITRRRR